MSPAAAGASNGPTVSVAIPAHNRGALLSKTLDGLARQTLPQALFDVIVVDNASTDDTSVRVADHAARVTNVKYRFEPRLGLSFARNTAWQVSTAEYVAFLDDDAVPAEDWAERVIGAFEHVMPQPACVGGRIDPLYETPPPSWLKGALLDFLTVVDHSPSAMFLTDIMHRQKLAGANFAFRRSTLQAVGGFHPRLDRIGDTLLSGGDILIQLQLERMSMPVYYDPQIRVLHHVSASRLTPEWMASRAYWGGVSDSILSFANRPTTLWWAIRTVSWSVRSLLTSPGLMSTLLRPANDRTLEPRCLAWHRIGSVVGALRTVPLALAGES